MSWGKQIVNMKSVYIIPKENEIEESLRLSEKYHANFEYNDFFLPFILDDEEKKKELIEFYKSLPRDRSMDTLHGAFLDVTLHSADRKIKEISEFEKYLIDSNIEEINRQLQNIIEINNLILNNEEYFIKSIKNIGKSFEEGNNRNSKNGKIILLKGLISII